MVNCTIKFHAIVHIIRFSCHVNRASRGVRPFHSNYAVRKLGHYIFISSLSVYKDWIPHHIKEDYILQPEPTEEQIKAVENGEVSPYEYYGALKVLCEKKQRSIGLGVFYT